MSTNKIKLAEQSDGGGGIPNPFGLTADITPTALSSSQNDYNPTGLSTADVLRLSTTGGNDYNITGLAGGSDGRILAIHNIGTSGTITLKDESASSSAANRFALANDVALQPEQSITLQYDATSSRWRAIGLHGAIFDDVGGDPQDVSSTPSDGSSPYPARRDHVHKGGTWELINDINLTSGDQASFDFQSIPPTYKHLKILLSGRSTRAGQVFDSVTLKANNDTGNNYFGYIQFRGGSSEQVSAGAPFALTYVAAASSPTNWQSNAEVTIFNYANTNVHKTWQSRGMDFENSAAGGLWIYDGGGIWASTSAINRITLTPSNGNWKQYSRATLFGIK